MENAFVDRWRYDVWCSDAFLSGWRTTAKVLTFPPWPVIIAKHKVYMSFFLRSGWFVPFLEPDLKTPLPRTFNSADPEKLRGLARRGGALDTLESKQKNGAGHGDWQGRHILNLTHEQYAKLTRP